MQHTSDEYVPVLTEYQRRNALALVAHLIGPENLLPFMGANKLTSDMIHAKQELIEKIQVASAGKDRKPKDDEDEG